MKQQFKLLGISLFIFFAKINYVQGQTISDTNFWKAHWITATESQSATNTWICFRKEVDLKGKPVIAIAKIAVDSKYWLWINGRMVIFEGGLKRGPNPQDTYFDEVDLAPYLVKGKNSIAVLLWYFGKDGFSHSSSGKAGLIFQCEAAGEIIKSDQSWNARVNPAFEHSPSPLPNYRLSESNIFFDAQKDLGKWQELDFEASLHGFSPALEIGMPPCAPWNFLVKRPIPQWKDYGLKNYESKRIIVGEYVDTIICRLPYNSQITPYLKIESMAGKTIIIQTDDYAGGGALNVRAGYSSKSGLQEYESYGWMNGNEVYYFIPKGVNVLDLKYRETGYNSDFAGDFESSDSFLNLLWKKARRTLYITMRDSYMDCPDRERAQWIGDEVNETGEAFYALDARSHLLQKKGMYELIGWQRSDSTLYGPIPAGNWSKELPCQILAAVGYYGFWNYYLNTGDKKPILDLYEGVKKYMGLWKINNSGTVIFRRGDWTWGDWGENIDTVLLENAWYYLAMKGMRNMAQVLEKKEEAQKCQQVMDNLYNAFNKEFWNGKSYRSTDYKYATDDRGQALAVVSGLADKEKYPALFKNFKQEEHASPYMEKYVLEALFIMGEPDYGLTRMKKRFGPMVNFPGYSTLFEGWGIGENGYGGGTFNHAWSGGGLTILSQYLCGIAPLEPGYKLFQIIPEPGSILSAKATVCSVSGYIKSSFVNSQDKFSLTAEVPQTTEAIIGIPKGRYGKILLNGKLIWSHNHYLNNQWALPVSDKNSSHISFKVANGIWKFDAIKIK